MNELGVRFELYKTPGGLNIRAYYDHRGSIISVEEALAAGQARETMLRVMNLMQIALEEEDREIAEMPFSGL